MSLKKSLKTSLKTSLKIPALLVLMAFLADGEGQALRVLASDRGINIGCAYKNGGGPGTYNNTLAREFNGLVGENVMKWDGLQATRGNFTFSAADAMVSFGAAEQHDSPRPHLRLASAERVRRQPARPGDGQGDARHHVQGHEDPHHHGDEPFPPERYTNGTS